MFSTCYVEPDKTGAFESLMMPSVVNRLSKGEQLPIIGLLFENVAIGAIVLRTKGEKTEIMSLYVAPDYRRQGGGTMLLETADQLAGKLDSRLVARFTVVDKETGILEKTLKAYGLKKRNDKEARTYMATIAECDENEKIKNESHDKKLVFFSQLTDAKLKSHAKLAESKGIYVPKGGFISDRLNRQLSAVFEEKGGIGGFITVENISYKDGIRITAAYNNDENPLIMLWLLRAVLAKALESFSDKTPLFIDVTGATADKYVRYLLPEATVVSRTYYKTV